MPRIAVAIAATTALASAQAAPLPRTLPPASARQLDLARCEPDQVVLKLAEGSGARLRRDGIAAAGADALRRTLADRRVSRFFTASDAELAALRARVLAGTPPGEAPPADLALYFLVHTAGADDTRALLAALGRLAIVEVAYPKELPAPPPGDIPPVTQSFAAQQLWQGAAPDGIDALAARGTTGAWGRDTTVLDIEWGWDFDHEDIAALRPTSLRGPPISNPSYNNHGTAVGGELCADPDQYGVHGVIPDIRMLCVTDFPATGYSVANAIVTGLPFLRAHDVMLLEAQTRTPLGLGPTEWNQADFDAIQNATRAGILVVEAGGNGGVNLDDPRMNGLFDLAVRDSGAMIVGATSGAARFAAPFTAYGSRIDANGWGGSVVTTGYGDLFNPGGDRRQHYTRSFSGTSSASPMVTSAVAGLLGAAKAQWDPADVAAIDHRLVRTLLRTTGTAMDPGNTRAIGTRPDLGALLRAAGLLRGLRVVDEARGGQTHHLEIAADFAAGASDGWALLAAPAAANLAIGLPAPCGRLLVDPAAMVAPLVGTFAGGSPQVVPVAVPAAPELNGMRVYWQALTLRASDARLCLSSGGTSYVMP